MMEVYRWRQLERWDAFSIPHLHVAPHLPQVRIGDLLEPRTERVDRGEWSFEKLCPITIHFGGAISRRKVKAGTDYTLPLLWVRPGDVVLSKIDLKNGAVGVLEDGWDNVVVTTHFKVYRPDLTRLNPRYFRMLLQTADFKDWLWASRSGADGRTEVKLDIFEDLNVPLPSLAEQDALVTAYDAALTQAASKEADAALIAQAGQRAFEEALGVAPPPPLPDRPVFIARFKDVERWSHEGVLRDMTHTAVTSAKWPMVSLSSVGKVSYGLQKSPANRPGKHSRPYLRVANVQRGVLDLAELKYMDVPDEDMPKLRLMDGDVLLCEGNSPDLVGRGAIWRDEIPDCIHQNHVLRVRVDPSKLLPDFLLAVINSSHGQAYFRSKAKRTTNLASINSTEVAALPVPLPPTDRQEALVTALADNEKASKAVTLEASELRRAAWAAFEAALFEPGT